MSTIFHPATGFAVADPDSQPLDPDALPTHEEVEKAASGLILSASGWRKVFASPALGEPRAPWIAEGVPKSASGRLGVDENSLSARVSPADIVVAGAAALVFYEELAARSGRPDPALLIGIDSRPTGPALADAMVE